MVTGKGSHKVKVVQDAVGKATVFTTMLVKRLAKDVTTGS